MRLPREDSKNIKETLGHMNEVREIKKQSVKEMEKELPVSEKPRAEMRRERLTLSNPPPDSLRGRIVCRPLVCLTRQFQWSGRGLV